jgi:hypothetical protein
MKSPLEMLTMGHGRSKRLSCREHLPEEDKRDFGYIREIVYH